MRIITLSLMVVFALMVAQASAYSNISYYDDFETLGENGTFNDPTYSYDKGDDNDTATLAACLNANKCGVQANQTTTGNVIAVTVSYYTNRWNSGNPCGIAYYSYNNDSWVYTKDSNCYHSNCGTGHSVDTWRHCTLPPDAYNESPLQVQWYGATSGGGLNIARLRELNFSITEDYDTLLSNAYDEETLTKIDFNVTISNSTQSDTFNNIYAIKLDDVASGLSTLTYESDGYTERQILATLADYDVNISAYLLTTGNGIYHSTTVLRQGTDTPIEGATVTVQTNIGGVYKTIEQHTTDSVGLALNYLDPTTLYHFVVSSGGYVSETFDIYPNPVSPILYVRLLFTGAEGASYVNFTSVFTNISHQFLPDAYYQNDTFNATFEIVDAASGLQGISFNATWPNGSLLCSEYVNDQPSGTLLTCTIPFVPGIYTVQGTFEKPSYGNFTLEEVKYWVFNSTEGVPDISTAVSGFTYFMAVLVIASIFAAFLAKFSLYGSGIAFVVVVAISLGLNPTLTVGDVPGWSILGAMALGVIAIMFMRSRL